MCWSVMMKITLGRTAGAAAATAAERRRAKKFLMGFWSDSTKSVRVRRGRCSGTCPTLRCEILPPCNLRPALRRDRLRCARRGTALLEGAAHEPAEPLHHVGMIRRDVVFLRRIGGDIVELIFRQRAEIGGGHA